MPSRQQLESALRNADKAGDTQAAAMLANALKTFEQPIEKVDPSEGLSPAQAALIGVGSGFVRAGRGVKGLFGALVGSDKIKEDVRAGAREQREIMAPLKERMPITTGAGEILGEVAATIPAGLGAGAAGFRAAKALGARAAQLAAAGTAGATEGAIIGAAEDQAITGALAGGGIGLALESVAPRLGKLFRKVTGRELTQGDIATTEAIDRLRAQLAESGASADEIAGALDDISRLGDVPEAVTAEQLARQAAFQEEGIPIAARSRITQQTDDFAREIQLSRQRDSESANQLRQQLFLEDEAIEQRARDLAREMGEPEEVGATIQTAVNNLRSEFGTRRRAAYRDLSNLVDDNPEISEMVPLPVKRVRDSIEEAQKILPSNDSGQEALDSLMAEYGLIGDKIVVGPRYSTAQFLDDEGNVIDSIRFRGKPSDLNIGTSERFRQRINNILDPRDPRQNAAARIIKSEYDQSIDDLVENIPGLDVPEEIAEAAKKARKIAREEKVVFNAKRIIDRISKSAQDGNPLMDASKVYDSVRRASDEDFNKLLSGLRSGVKGADGALNNLKAAALIDFTEQATKTARKITGESGASRNIFSGTNFTKAINRFGRRKAQRLFGNQWSNIRRLEVIGESRIAPDAAVQKGSAPDLINNMINTFSRLSEKVPVAGTRLADVATDAAERRTLQQVSDLTPTRDQVDDYIAFSAKRLSSVLGLTPSAIQGLTEIQEDNQ